MRKDVRQLAACLCSLHECVLANPISCHHDGRLTCSLHECVLANPISCYHDGRLTWNFTSPCTAYTEQNPRGNRHIRKPRGRRKTPVVTYEPRYASEEHSSCGRRCDLWYHFNYVQLDTPQAFSWSRGPIWGQLNSSHLYDNLTTV
jgi:hypothetical protein